MLLALQGLALSLGAMMLVWIILLHRRAHAHDAAIHPVEIPPMFQLTFGSRPANWLAIHSTDPLAVETALGITQSTPCPWVEGMTGDHEFFIGPPVNGWIVVTGSGLPNPSCDVDDCFRFLTELSRKLGSIQFFQADRVLHHHAWVRLEKGLVIRAYAWAGETVWHEGRKTDAETELSMKCSGYGEDPNVNSWAAVEWTAANVGKVPLLAARWSLDPARVDGRLRKQADGVAGKSPRPD